MIHFHILTLFPESFSYLEQSMLGRARRAKKISVRIYDLRSFAEGKHRITDDAPYGGGPGMVMKVEPIARALKKIIGRKKSVKVIAFSPSGKQFSASLAWKTAERFRHVVLIAGHYEGVDERVVKIFRAEKISLGPYVLTGGELPAMVVIDAVARHVPNVLGKRESLEETRSASPEVYTRPSVFEYKGKKYRVPGVLLSGDHKKITEWRKARRHRYG